MTAHKLSIMATGEQPTVSARVANRIKPSVDHKIGDTVRYRGTDFTVVSDAGYIKRSGL